MHYEQDTHIESNGTRVTNNGGDGFIGRLGARITLTSLKDDGFGIHPYIETNLWSGKPVANSVTLDGATFSSDSPDSRYEFKTGMQGNLNSNLKVWASLNGSVAQNDYYDYGGMAGLTYQFK